MSAHSSSQDFTSKAATAHGAACPDWIKVLAKACDKSGTVRPVAVRIGYSHSTVSAVINGCYPGNLDKIETAVKSCLMDSVVTCPVLGTIASEKCLGIQRRKTLSATDPTTVKLWRACRSGCPNSGVKS